MFVALDDDGVVGVIAEKWGNGLINLLYVDGAYHRQGIATALMSLMVCELKLRKFDKITLLSSACALPFYQHYGFKPTDSEKRQGGFVFTPMEYTPREIWDVYDENRSKTGRFHERSRPMKAGCYHLIVHVWKHNGKGEWLIDRRSDSDSSIAGLWETTGGSALAGEDSLRAALRESKEELGLVLDDGKGELFHSSIHQRDGHAFIRDVWVFEHDCSIGDIVFQESETCDAMWAAPAKIREMMDSGEFLGLSFYPYFDEMVENCGVAK
jgi:8-oxo-dGTP pyrophosphatase MutT (NUDIX family)